METIVVLVSKDLIFIVKKLDASRNKKSLPSKTYQQ